MAISNTWFKGVKNPDVKKDIRSRFPDALPVRRRLQEICELKIKEAQKQSGLSNNYDKPNWAMWQADLVGYKRALTEISELLSENLQYTEQE